MAVLHVVVLFCVVFLRSVSYSSYCFVSIISTLNIANIVIGARIPLHQLRRWLYAVPPTVHCVRQNCRFSERSGAFAVIVCCLEFQTESFLFHFVIHLRIECIEERRLLASILRCLLLQIEQSDM